MFLVKVKVLFAKKWYHKINAIIMVKILTTGEDWTRGVHSIIMLVLPPCTICIYCDQWQYRATRYLCLILEIW